MGENAQGVPPTNFGSAFLTPVNWISEIDGIRNLVGSTGKVDFSTECTPDPSIAQWQFNSAPGLQAQYFNSSDLSGSPQVTRIDQEVNFDWTTNPIPVSNRSLCGTGKAASGATAQGAQGLREGLPAAG
jgi:beta-glucosidase